MKVRNNAFIVSWVADSAFNQIKGRSLVGFFNNNQLVRIDIDGNGQAIYYPKEEDDNKLIGVNKA